MGRLDRMLDRIRGDRLEKAGGGQIVGSRDLADLAQQLAPRNEMLPTPKSTPERDAALDQAGMRNLWPFSPGQPMAPFYPNLPPRQYQYNVGQNTAIGPRSEKAGTVSFGLLRDMSRSYDIARMCINVRIDELTHLDFDIVPRDEDDKGKFDDDCKQLRRFFEKPDGVTLLDRWVAMAADDWLSVDALTVYRHYNRAGNRLVALEAVDGTTIKPVLDARGRIPLPPAPAYQQWLWGVPMEEYTTQQLIYRPYWVRTDSPYGFPPIEWQLMTANTDIKMQWHYLFYFTAGNVPEGFGTVPDGWTPPQIKEWQDYWDAFMEGRPDMKRKVRFVPHGFSFTQFREAKFDQGFPEFLATKICAGYGVSPQEIGLTTKINKSTGEMQENVQHRRSIKPATDFFASIFDQVIAEDFGRPQLQFKYLGLDEEEDALKKAQRLQIYVGMGAISPDEVRSQELGLQVDANNPAGRVFISGSGVTPLDSVYSGAAAETPPQPDAAATGNQEGAQPTPQQQKPPPEAKSPDDQQQAPPPKQQQTEKAADMRRWQRKALERLKDGKAPSCQFKSDHLGKAAMAAIFVGLQNSKTADDVRAVFKEATNNQRPKRALPPKKPTKALNQQQQALSQGVGRFFEREGRNIADHVTGADEPVEALDAYDWDAHRAEFAAVVQPGLATIHGLGQEAAFESLAAYGSWTLRHQAAEAYARSQGAQLVGKRVMPDGTVVDNPNADYRINDLTRERLQSTIEDALADGLSMDDLADLIMDDFAFSGDRAASVARTETGTAYNMGSVSGYRDTGLVDSVEVMDGDSDPECEAANGQVWTLDEAEANPLEHPNCVRAFAPIVAGESDSGDEEDGEDM